MRFAKLHREQKEETRQPALHGAGLALVLVAAWILSYRAAYVFTIEPQAIRVWYLPAGVTLAVLLAAPGWLKLTPFLANLVLVVPEIRAAIDVPALAPEQALVYAIRFHLIYALACWLFMRHKPIGLPFRTLPDILRFLGLCLAAATLDTLAASGRHAFAEGGLAAFNFRVAEAWWIGAIMGAVSLPPLLVPVVLAWCRRSTALWPWPTLRQWIAQALVIAGCALLGALGPRLGVNLWYAIMPPVICFALYGGLRQAGSSALLTCLLPLLAAIALETGGELFGLAPLICTAMLAGLVIGAAIDDRSRAAQMLEKRVADRTAELEKAYELQRHLVRSLGHDLRQPMEAINLTMDGLAGHVTTEPATKALARARDLGAAASDLLTRILLYARLDVGDIQAHLVPFPVSELMERLRRLYDRPAQWRQVTLRWQFEERIIHSDRELLFQALANFIDNAIRLSPPGATISIIVAARDEGVAFLVEDGVDMPLQRRAGSGGLGLRIVGQIAALIGGTVIDDPNSKGIYLQGGS